MQMVYLISQATVRVSICEIKYLYRKNNSTIPLPASHTTPFQTYHKCTLQDSMPGASDSLRYW